MGLLVFREARFPTTEDTTDATAGDRTFTATSFGDPAGNGTNVAVVVTICADATAQPVTGVTYDGIAMTLQASATDATEAGSVWVYTLLGKGNVPTTTSPSIVLQGATTSNKFAFALSVLSNTAGMDVELADTDSLSTQGPNTTRAMTVTATAGRSALALGGMHDGNTEPPETSGGAYTYTSDMNISASYNRYADYGTRAAQASSTVASTTGSISFGWTTAVSEDWCMAVIALAEAPVVVSQTFIPRRMPQGC